MKQNIDTIDQIMNSMTFPVIIIDLENKISIINIAGENFLKSSSKMIVGNTIENYLPFSSPLLDLIRKCKKDGVGFNEYGLDLSNPRIGTKKDLLKLKEVLIEYNIGGFIIGLPISLDNSENKQSQLVRNFNNELIKFFDLPSVFWDERFTSDVIFREMRKSKMSKNRIKKKLDQQSASYILQGYLDRYSKSN